MHCIILMLFYLFETIDSFNAALVESDTLCRLLQSTSGTLQSSVLVSRKSSSTPSLSEAAEPKLTVASTDQVASAENLTSAMSQLVSHICAVLYFL